MYFLTTLIYAIVFQICQTNTPFMGPHPSIKTGRVLVILAQNYQTQYFITTYYLGSDSSNHKAYKIPYPDGSLREIPKVGLGIYSMQYDSSHFSTPDFDLGLTAENISSSDFGLRVRNMNNPINFIKSLGVTYICVIKNDVPEIINLNRIGGIQTISLATPSNNLKTMTSNQPYQNPPTSNYLKGWILLAGFCIQSADISYISLEYRQYSSNMFQIIISTNFLASLRILTVYAIVVDYSVGHLTYKLYTQVKIQTNNITRNIFSTLSLDPHQFFIGISKIYALQSGSTVGFQIMLDQGGWVKAFNQFEQICIDYLGIALPQCANGMFYFPRNNSCVEKCIDGNSLENRYCLTCARYCTQCSDNVTCQTCQDGYYLKDSKTCQSCSVFSYGCTVCSLDSGCIECDANGLFTAPNPSCECVTNSQRESDLSDCQCLSQYYEEVGECLACSALCKQCNGSYANNCVECDLEVYRLSDGTSCPCRENFIQLCEDTTANGGTTGGNTGGTTGGRDPIVVATTPGGTTGTTTSPSDCNPSVCYLDPSIQFKFTISIQKDPMSNTLTYSINIQPALPFLNQLDFNKIINLGLPKSTDIKSSYENGLLTVHAEYKQGINNLQTMFNFSLTSLGSLSFSQTENVVIKYSVSPTLPADAYTQQQYILSKYLKYASYALSCLSVLVFIFGLYSSKLVVLEMMAVLQVSFFGLFLLELNTPFVSALFPLRYTNGFSDIFEKSKGIIPNSIHLTGYDEQILNNINIMSILIILPLLFALLFFILAKTNRHQSKKYSSYFKFCVGEWCLSAVLFSLYNMSVSVGVLASYMTVRSGWKFLLGIIEISFDFAIGIFSFILYGLKDYNYLGEFKYLFAWTTFSLNYYYFHIGLRILFGFLLATMSMFYWIGAIVSGGLLAIAIVTGITRPYSDTLHTIRSVINLVFSSIILFIYTLIAANPSNPGYTKLPIIIIVLLFLTVFMALGFIIRQIKKDIESEKELNELTPPVNTLQQEEKVYDQFLKKQIEESKNDEKNFVNKLLLAHKRKKKKKLSNPLIQNENEPSKSGDEEVDDRLTVEKFMKVDQMLKDGLM